VIFIFCKKLGIISVCSSGAGERAQAAARGVPEFSRQGLQRIAGRHCRALFGAQKSSGEPELLEFVKAQEAAQCAVPEPTR